MTYNKPKVIKLDSALSAIQGVVKTFILPDNRDPQHEFDATTGAYEADE
jgi:hypothetical protein